MLESFFNKFKKKKEEESIEEEQVIKDTKTEEEKEESPEKDKEKNEEIQLREKDDGEKIEETASQGIDMDDENNKEDLEGDSRSFLQRLKDGLTKTRSNLSNKIDQMLASYHKVDGEMMEDLEDILISSDMGVETTMDIVDALEERIKLKRMDDPSEVKKELVSIIKEKIEENEMDHGLSIAPPSIILVVGVNGVGKTTTIGKMAHRFKKEGKTVQLAAADTFRAAAIEQLTEWANRANVPIIAHSEGADPAAVIYDAIQSAKSKKTDVLICDTAGRLHNKKNLMNELEKINRIIQREYGEAQKEVFLVVDGTTGQNAIFQAKEFKNVTDLTGVIITKLDGTAKGGMVIPLELELGLPVKLIGIGEQMNDLVDFKVDEFIDAIVS
ncbi:MAG: signal recognition particle-docking protein FtsY [Tissierellia bacterium]|nr:signal recognition particle-docking protein FtsY [Tissierellia bacterium]